MTTCWVLRSRLIYFWRNMNISSIFYFSKSTSINTQYSNLWDTLNMMLFTKCLIKWKRIARINWKFRYWFILILSIELNIKRWTYLSNVPLIRPYIGIWLWVLMCFALGVRLGWKKIFNLSRDREMLWTCYAHLGIFFNVIIRHYWYVINCRVSVK